MIKGHTSEKECALFWYNILYGLFICKSLSFRYNMLKKYKKSLRSEYPFYFALNLKKIDDTPITLLIKPKCCFVADNG